MSSPSPSSSPDWVRSYGTSPDNWKAAERRASPESVMTGTGTGFASSALESAMFSYHPHAVGAGHAAHFAFNAGVVNHPAVAGSGHRPGPVPGQHFHYNWVGSPFRA